MHVEEFRRHYSGFARKVFEALYDRTDLNLRVECSPRAILDDVREICPRLADGGFMPSDVAEVINSLPVVEILRNEEGLLVVRFPHLRETALAELERVLGDLDDRVLNAVWGRTFGEHIEVAGQTDPNLVQVLTEIEQRNRALDDLATSASTREECSDFELLVAREWNSWTPSLFPVPGGCYALISPHLGEGPRDTHSPSVIVIDPGFRFLEILRNRFGIGVADVDAVIISHFHPDHVGGLFEYLALRHTIYRRTQRRTRLWLNATTRSVFGKLSAAFETSTLTPGKQTIILDHTSEARSTRSEVIVEPFTVNHWELGNDNESLGFVITVSKRGVQNAGGLTGTGFSHQIVIAGDTAYFPELADRIFRSDVIILHLGSFRRGSSTARGKHLYYQGLVKVLEDCGTKIRASGREARKKVLISEIGLEHAPLTYLRSHTSIQSAELFGTLRDRDYLGYIEQFVRDRIAEWGDAWVARLGTRVILGTSINVE